MLKFRELIRKLFDSVIHAKNACVFAYCWKNYTGYEPQFVTINLTYQCNLRCIMCDVWRLNKTNPEMAQELPINRILSLLDELCTLGTKHVEFSGGECTLRKDFPEILSYATTLGFTTSIVTNGTRISKTLANKLVESGVEHITLSIDSAVPNIHDEIRGIPGAWELTIMNLKNLIEIGEKKRSMPIIMINSLVTKLNYHVADRMLDLREEIFFDKLRFIPFLPYYSIPLFKTGEVVKDYSNFALTYSDILNFNKEIAPKIKEKAQKYSLKQDLDELAHPFGKSEKEIENFLGSGRSRDFYKNVHCFIPYFQSQILPNGDITPCCIAPLWEYSMGNIKQQSFLEIWNGNKYKDFRKKCRYPSMPLCHECGSAYRKKNELIMKKYRMLGPFRRLLE